MTNTTDVTEKEAATIAKEIDPRAGGFFLRMMVNAALRGALLQRMKLLAAEGHKEEINGGFAELRKQFHDAS